MLSKNATTATDRSKIERESGARYSELLRLPYFDVIRFHVVDPMHNLFLGIAKHTTETWKLLNILKSPHFCQLQDKVDRILPPPKIVRIPRKISSGFSSFTADEWILLFFHIFFERHSTRASLFLLVHFCSSLHSDLPTNSYI